MNKFKSFPTLLVLCSLIAGCATHGRVIVTRMVPGEKGTGDPASIQIFDQPGLPDQPFDVLGQVTLSFVNNKQPVRVDKDETLAKACVEEMKRQAAAMGGNAVVGVYRYKMEMYDQNPGADLNVSPSFMTGLIVRLLDKSQQITYPRGNFIVGILPLDTADKDPAKLAFTQKWSFRYAQQALANKGYYVLPEPQDLKGREFLKLADLQESEVNPLCGAPADQILGLQLAGQKKGSIILISSEHTTIEAALFSKTGRKIAWSDSKTGSASTGWLINMIAPHGKEAMALQSAINSALNGAPNLTTTSLSAKFTGGQIAIK